MGHFWSVAKGAPRVGCAKQSNNPKRYLIHTSSKFLYVDIFNISDQLYFQLNGRCWQRSIKEWSLHSVPKHPQPKSLPSSLVLVHLSSLGRDCSNCFWGHHYCCTGFSKPTHHLEYGQVCRCRHQVKYLYPIQETLQTLFEFSTVLAEFVLNLFVPQNGLILKFST